MPVGHMQLVCSGARTRAGRGERHFLELSARERQRAHENNIPSRGPLPLKKQPLSKKPPSRTPLKGDGSDATASLGETVTKATKRQRGKTPPRGQKEETDRCFFFFFLFFLCFCSYRDPPACGVQTVPQLREDAPNRFGIAWFRLSWSPELLLLHCSVRLSVRQSVPRFYAPTVCLTDTVFFPLVLRGSQ